MNRTRLPVAVVLTSFCLGTPRLMSQELVVNGEFEADTFTVWPGYVGGGNAAELTEPLAGGDATFLLDNLSLVPAGGGDELVVNGDFDADANRWEATTNGTGMRRRLLPSSTR